MTEQEKNIILKFIKFVSTGKDWYNYVAVSELWYPYDDDEAKGIPTEVLIELYEKEQKTGGKK